MKKFIPLLLAAAVFSSCVPSTPQARIERSPEKFAALGKKDQELVRKGLITRGMSPDAVQLAWGLPAQRFEGSKNSKATERWDYTGSQPVYVTGAMGMYGYGYGYGYNGFGPYGRAGYYGLGPEIAYVPYRVASVWFINSRVDSWERAH